MLYGALVYIDKDKKQTRDIEGAIQKGLRLYERHHGKVQRLTMVALVNPKMYREQELEGKTFSIDVDSHSNVPYAHLWVCKLGDVDYDRQEKKHDEDRQDRLSV